MFTECQATLQQVENSWETVGQQYQNALTQHEATSKAVQESYLEAQRQKQATLDMLKTLRAQLEARNKRIHRLTQFYEKSYQKIEEERKKPVKLIQRPTQVELDQLEMKVETVLRFDSLLERKRKIEAEWARAVDEKKEMIKKTKLNISLAELELKDLHESTKRNTRH